MKVMAPSYSCHEVFQLVNNCVVFIVNSVIFYVKNVYNYIYPLPHSLSLSLSVCVRACVMHSWEPVLLHNIYQCLLWSSIMWQMHLISQMWIKFFLHFNLISSLLSDRTLMTSCLVGYDLFMAKYVLSSDQSVFSSFGHPPFYEPSVFSLSDPHWSKAQLSDTSSLDWDILLSHCYFVSLISVYRQSVWHSYIQCFNYRFVEYNSVMLHNNATPSLLCVV